MISTASFLTTLVLSLAVAAGPVLQKAPISLPAKSLVAQGHARANGQLNIASAPVNQPIENQVTSYIATIGIGSPATEYQLIVDTGSSNTWVGAGKTYAKTSTSRQTPNKVSVSYPDGSFFSGTEFTDTLTIASDLVIATQSIGVASTSAGFVGVDGKLGIGPVILTLGTLNPATTTLIPTVTDNSFSQGQIPEDSVGISFQPNDQLENVNGEITWGGVDTTKFTGSIAFTPITKTSPASEFWGINQSIRYGTSATILGNTAGIVDSGTVLILIATNALNTYKMVTGAVSDPLTSLLKLTPSQFQNLQSLFFTTNGITYELTANAQIWPRALNTAIGGVAGNIYLIVNDIGTESGSGLEFINGMTFLERFYAVLDTTNKQVGFATTPFTDSILN